MTICVVNGRFMAGPMRSLDVAVMSFWMLDGLCGAHPPVNDNARLRALP